MPLERLLQSYLWRWEIELNFRDEKTVLGVGEAQLRTKAAVEAVPAFIAASYAFLPLIGTVRSQLWGKAMGINLRDFVKRGTAKAKPVLFEKSLPAAVCYAFR